MEVGAAVHNSLCVFSHAAVQFGNGGGRREADRVEIARAQTAAAAHAVRLVDVHLALHDVEDQAVVGAFPLAALAAAALFFVDLRLAVVVLILLAGARAAAHADVFDRAAKAGRLMALEVGQADEHVRIHNRAADLRRLEILAAVYRHFNVVGALQAIADQYGTVDGQGRKAVLPGALEVLQSIFAAAGIERVAVGQKGLAAQLLHNIHNGAGIVGAQIADVAQLAKVYFDGDELAVQIEIGNAGSPDQLLQLGRQAVAKGFRAKIRKINLGLFHGAFLSSMIKSYSTQLTVPSRRGARSFGSSSAYPTASASVGR